MQADNYGRTCTTVESAAQAGDLYGRTTFYRPANDGQGFDFAFSSPFNDGLRGNQFVQTNTFSPGIPTNFTANWVSVTNTEGSEQQGEIIFYAADGSVLSSQSVTLPTAGRRDFSAHQFGANRVGLAEWRPADASARAVVSNVRYFYDNPTGALSFNGAMPVGARKGTGDTVVLSLDRLVGPAEAGLAVLELSNVLAEDVTVNAKFRSGNGTLLDEKAIELAARSTTHIIADQIDIDSLGSVALIANKPQSILATASHYDRDFDLSLRAAYSIPAIRAAGAALNGSYNTFLNQDQCRLVLVNTSTSDITVSVDLTRFDGDEVLSDQIFGIEARGATGLNICSTVPADEYGAVAVTPSAAGSLIGHVVRDGDDYQFLYRAAAVGSVDNHRQRKKIYHSLDS